MNIPTFNQETLCACTLWSLDGYGQSSKFFSPEIRVIFPIEPPFFCGLQFLSRPQFLIVKAIHRIFADLPIFQLGFLSVNTVNIPLFLDSIPIHSPSSIFRVQHLHVFPGRAARASDGTTLATGRQAQRVCGGQGATASTPLFNGLIKAVIGGWFGSWTSKAIWTS